METCTVYAGSGNDFMQINTTTAAITLSVLFHGGFHNFTQTPIA